MTFRLVGAGKSLLKVLFSPWGHERPHVPDVRMNAWPGGIQRQGQVASADGVVPGLWYAASAAAGCAIGGGA